jgi:hypothetical protein
MNAVQILFLFILVTPVNFRSLCSCIVMKRISFRYVHALNYVDFYG